MNRSRLGFGGLLPDRHLAPVLTVVFAGVLVSTLLAYFYTKNTVEGLALGQTTQALGFIDREVSARISVMTANLVLWSQEDVFRLALEDSYLGQSAREAGQRRLAGRVVNKDFAGLYLIRPDGEIVVASMSGLERGVNVADRGYFIRAMAGERAFETIAAGWRSGRPTVAVATPILGPGNTVLGVLASGIGTEIFADELLRSVPLGASGLGVILDGQGLVLAASSPNEAGKTWPKARLAEVLAAADSGKIIVYSDEGTERMLVAKANGPTGWYLVLTADEAEVLRPATRLAWISGVISAATLALVLVALGALRRALAGIRQSEEKFSKLFLLSPDSIILMDMETCRIVDVNETFVRRWGFGRQEAIGKTTFELSLYTDQEGQDTLYARLLGDGRVENFEIEANAKDGSLSMCTISGQIMDIGRRRYLMLIVRDITEQKKMHEMMVQTEKMISVGGIAAGIAHEINNPLGIILQASQNLIQRTRPDFKKNVEAATQIGLDMGLLQKYMRARQLDVFIEDIRSAALRASSIIRHMLDFSRRSESRRTLCDIAAIADRALDLASNDYDLRKSYDFKKIAIVKEYASSVPAIGCTATELEQVFLNVLRNAAQAMAAADPPVAEPCIAVRIRDLSDRVCIELEDNGPGMAENVRRRIFEPFYTTKPPGVGTGLGLSVSYFIVTKGHGGRMSVKTSPGGGALFGIELPKDGALEQT